jgi:hypothetical protein
LGNMNGHFLVVVIPFLQFLSTAPINVTQLYIYIKD